MTSFQQKKQKKIYMTAWERLENAKGGRGEKSGAYVGSDYSQEDLFA